MFVCVALAARGLEGLAESPAGEFRLQTKGLKGRAVTQDSKSEATENQKYSEASETLRLNPHMSVVGLALNPPRTGPPSAM